MKIPVYKRGMTLVEMLLVTTIIGMLAAFLVPELARAIRSRQTGECARKLRMAVDAFELYASETGSYPPDQTVPGQTSVPAMEEYYFPYFKIDWWGNATELGGRWDWDVGYHGFNFSVSIWSPSAPAEQMVELDRLVDDGNLNTGNFRKSGSQYHYIIED